MGSRQPAQTTQTNRVELSPEQQQMFDLAFPFMQQYAQSPLPTIPGQTIAPFNPNEVAAQTGAIQQATGQGQALGNQAAASSMFLMDPSILNPSSNPYLAAHGDAITQSMTRNLNENILPGLRSGASVSGGPYSGGSSKEGQQIGMAVGRTQDAVGSSLSSLYNNAYSTGLSTMLDATRQLPITQSGLLFGSSVQGQVGGQQRAMEQAQLDEANWKTQIQQMLPYMRAQDIMALFQGMPGGQGVSTVTGAQPKGPSAWQSALGGAAAGSAFGPWGTAIGGGAGLLASLLS